MLTSPNAIDPFQSDFIFYAPILSIALFYQLGPSKRRKLRNSVKRDLRINSRTSKWRAFEASSKKSDVIPIAVHPYRVLTVMQVT
jgi:hypothetical protein